MSENTEPKKRNPFVNYFVESLQELGKVAWPTRHRAVNICILVVVFVGISALAIAGIDFIFNFGYRYLFTLSQS
ncbi:MAG: preprotein translocase subunit SecE [Patescibacteria group bacterium]